MALDPEATFDVWLACDADKPRATRPTFECRFLSCREWRKIAEAFDHLDGTGGGSAVLGRIMELVGRCVSGFRNMIDPETKGAIPFSAEGLERVLTMTEAQELIQKALGGRPDEEDLKNSPSPAVSP